MILTSTPPTPVAMKHIKMVGLQWLRMVNRGGGDGHYGQKPKLVGRMAKWYF